MVRRRGKEAWAGGWGADDCSGVRFPAYGVVECTHVYIARKAHVCPVERSLQTHWMCRYVNGERRTATDKGVQLPRVSGVASTRPRRAVVSTTGTRIRVAESVRDTEGAPCSVEHRKHSKCSGTDRCITDRRSLMSTRTLARRTVSLRCARLLPSDILWPLRSRFGSPLPRAPRSRRGPGGKMRSPTFSSCAVCPGSDRASACAKVDGFEVALRLMRAPRPPERLQASRALPHPASWYPGAGAPALGPLYGTPRKASSHLPCTPQGSGRGTLVTAASCTSLRSSDFFRPYLVLTGSKNLETGCIRLLSSSAVCLYPSRQLSLLDHRHPKPENRQKKKKKKILKNTQKIRVRKAVGFDKEKLGKSEFQKRFVLSSFREFIKHHVRHTKKMSASPALAPADGMPGHVPGPAPAPAPAYDPPPPLFGPHRD